MTIARRAWKTICKGRAPRRRAAAHGIIRAERDFPRDQLTRLNPLERATKCSSVTQYDMNRRSVGVIKNGLLGQRGFTTNVRSRWTNIRKPPFEWRAQTCCARCDSSTSRRTARYDQTRKRARLIVDAIRKRPRNARCHRNRANDREVFQIEVAGHARVLAHDAREHWRKVAASFGAVRTGAAEYG